MTNGHVSTGEPEELSRDSNPPRLEDLVVIDEKGEGEDNPASALIDFPPEQRDWVGRTNLDDPQITAILQRRQRSLFWHPDARMDNFIHFAAGIMNSRDGRGRMDYLEGIKGQTPQVENKHLTQRMVEAKNGEG